MVNIAIKTDFGGVMSSLDQLHNDIRERAGVSAVNKTLEKARTAMVREIAREFNVQQSYVRDRLRIERARFVGGKAVISGALDGSSGKRSANLIAFVEKSVTLAQAKKRAKQGNLSELRFQVKRKGGKFMIPGAFIANKGRTVFIREGKPRLPIKALSTIDVPQMFNTQRINREVVRLIEREFPEIFNREVRYYTDRFNKSGR